MGEYSLSEWTVLSGRQIASSLSTPKFEIGCGDETREITGAKILYNVPLTFNHANDRECTTQAIPVRIACVNSRVLILYPSAGEGIDLSHPLLIRPHRKDISHNHNPDAPRERNPYSIAHRLTSQ